MSGVGHEGEVRGQSEHEDVGARRKEYATEVDVKEEDDDDKGIKDAKITQSKQLDRNGDETDQEMPRRSVRTKKPTWKAQENLETEAINKFWKTIHIAKDLIRTVEDSITTDTSVFVREGLFSNARHLTENLDLVYREIRTICDMVPADVRQTADKYMQDLLKIQSRIDPDNADKRSNMSKKSGSSRASSTSSKKSLLAAQTASLRAEIEAKKIEGRKRLQLARLEAEEKARQAHCEAAEKTRRAEYEAQMEIQRQELRDQEMLTQLRKTEAELQALDEQEGLRSEVLSHHTRHSLHNGLPTEAGRENTNENYRTIAFQEDKPEASIDVSMPEQTE